MVKMIEGKHEGVHEVTHIFHQILFTGFAQHSYTAECASNCSATGSAESLKQAQAGLSDIS
jgi:hypothetical protein